jgi:hypothetical protein
MGRHFEEDHPTVGNLLFFLFFLFHAGFRVEERQFDSLSHCHSLILFCRTATRTESANCSQQRSHSADSFGPSKDGRLFRSHAQSFDDALDAGDKPQREEIVEEADDDLVPYDLDATLPVNRDDDGDGEVFEVDENSEASSREPSPIVGFVPLDEVFHRMYSGPLLSIISSTPNSTSRGSSASAASHQARKTRTLHLQEPRPSPSRRRTGLSRDAAGESG